MHTKLPPDIHENYRIATLEGMCANFALGLVNPFLGIFAIALGAPNSMVGLLVSLPALITMLTMIPASHLADRFPRKSPLVFWGALLNRMLYLPLAFIPFLPFYHSETLIAILGLMALPGVVLNISWTSMISHIFPTHYRSELFSRRNMWCGLVSLLATAAAGLLLDTIPYPYNWTVLFTTAFISANASTLLLRRHREPNVEETPIRRSFLQKARAMLSDPVTGRNLRTFLLASFVFHLGLNFSAPLWAIYLARELELANNLIGWMTTLMGATTVASSLYWGKKASLHGDEPVFMIALLAMAIWPGLFALNTHPAYMLGMHLVLGFFVAAFNLTIFNLLLSAANFQYKATSIAAFHTLNAFTGFLGPFLGTWSLHHISTSQALWVSALLRFGGFIVFAWGSRDGLTHFWRTLQLRRARAQS